MQFIRGILHGSSDCILFFCHVGPTSNRQRPRSALKPLPSGSNETKKQPEGRKEGAREEMMSGDDAGSSSRFMSKGGRFGGGGGRFHIKRRTNNSAEDLYCVGSVFSTYSQPALTIVQLKTAVRCGKLRGVRQHFFCTTHLQEASSCSPPPPSPAALAVRNDCSACE